jgi:hypothetical protein
MPSLPQSARAATMSDACARDRIDVGRTIPPQSRRLSSGSTGTTLQSAPEEHQSTKQFHIS